MKFLLVADENKIRSSLAYPVEIPSYVIIGYYTFKLYNTGIYLPNRPIWKKCIFYIQYGNILDGHEVQMHIADMLDSLDI